jgi:predicted dienelactone hydrolase
MPVAPNPIVVAGDSLGCITLLTLNSANQIENVTFGAHCEDKQLQAQVIEVFVHQSPGATPILCSLDNFGRLRLWT